MRALSELLSALRTPGTPQPNGPPAPELPAWNSYPQLAYDLSPMALQLTNVRESDFPQLQDQLRVELERAKAFLEG